MDEKQVEQLIGAGADAMRSHELWEPGTTRVIIVIRHGDLGGLQAAGYTTEEDIEEDFLVSMRELFESNGHRVQVFLQGPESSLN